MKLLKSIALFVTIAIFSIALAGCGVTKNKYEALLNEKIALEERLDLLTKSRDALRAEYESLLKDKMDLAAKTETLSSEKSALKGEYDKLLDEKVTLKASYDKLAAGQQAKELQAKTVKK